MNVNIDYFKNNYQADTISHKDGLGAFLERGSNLVHYPAQ